MDLLGALLVLVIFAGMAAPICLCLWFARIYKRRIRRWADERGYAIVRLQYKWWPPLLGRTILQVGCWFVEIQDEQGGIRRAYVHFPVRWLPPMVDVPWAKMHFEWR